MLTFIISRTQDSGRAFRVTLSSTRCWIIHWPGRPLSPDHHRGRECLQEDPWAQHCGWWNPIFYREKAKQQMSNFNMNIKTIVKNAPRYTIQEKLKTKFRTCKFKAVFSLWQFRKKKTYSGKKSMFQLKSGTLKFMLNACIYTLPTPANLRR